MLTQAQKNRIRDINKLQKLMKSTGASRPGHGTYTPKNGWFTKLQYYNNSASNSASNRSSRSGRSMSRSGSNRSLSPTVARQVRQAVANMRPRFTTNINAWLANNPNANRGWRSPSPSMRRSPSVNRRSPSPAGRRSPARRNSGRRSPTPF